MSTKSKISIVVPAFNEEKNVSILFKKLQECLNDTKFDVIYVDDGSSDATLDTIKRLCRLHKNVQYISFSRNFGHQAALRAGLRAADGDAAISMDADLQHPPEVIPELLAKWREGYDVVYTVRKDTTRTGIVKRLTSGWFYRLMNYLSELKIEEGAADFRLLDRKALRVINVQSEANLFLRGYVNWVGFRQIGIPYVVGERFAGTSKYTLKKMLQLAGNGATQFSIKPLRVGFAFAAITFSIVFIYVLYAVVIALTGGVVSGWLSLVTIIVMLQGMQFLLIGLIGEYLGRTFMQTKHRPEYIIAESSVVNKSEVENG